jgi:hypothetical protein
MAENSSGSAPPRRRVPGRPFVKGQSGNAGGRPKGLREVQDYAGVFTFEAVDTLVTIMRGRSQKEARQAAVAILDRACGKPAQPIGGVPGEPLRVAGAATVVGLLKKLAGETE